MAKPTRTREPPSTIFAFTLSEKQKSTLFRDIIPSLPERQHPKPLCRLSPRAGAPAAAKLLPLASEPMFGGLPAPWVLKSPYRLTK
jgi:hypothetical protein